MRTSQLGRDYDVVSIHGSEVFRYRSEGPSRRVAEHAHFVTVK